MLPFLNLPGSLAEMLSALRPCFTGPSFVTFCAWPGSRDPRVAGEWLSSPLRASPATAAGYASGLCARESTRAAGRPCRRHNRLAR